MNRLEVLSFSGIPDHSIRHDQSHVVMERTHLANPPRNEKSESQQVVGFHVEMYPLSPGDAAPGTINK